MATNGLPLPHARANDIVIREMPDELLVYDLKTHKAHCLNKTAALVWKYCDGKTSVAEIVTLIKSDLDMTVDEATVWFAVERLSRANLLEEPLTPPAGSPRLSRRESVRRLGLGFAVSVPVVMSIVAPAAAAAASSCKGQIGLPNCTSSPTPWGTAKPSACTGCGSAQGTCYNDPSCPGPGAGMANTACTSCPNGTNSWSPN